MTLFGMFMFLSSCMVGAVALDVTYFYAARTQLQVAADLAAHAALYKRELGTAAVAKAAAIAAVEVGMPEDQFGEVLSEAEITFGTWDDDAQTFTQDATSRAAVRVRTGRDEAGSNPVATFLFRTVGIDQMDIGAEAVFTTYRPFCLTEGFVAEGIVDLQSNNGFYEGFCIHSNAHVSVNQNNFFEPGTVVSMPDTADLDIPASGFDQNDGLEAALRSGVYDLRILDRIGSIDTGISTMGTAYTPDYLTSATPIPLGTTSLSPSSFTQGRVHTRTACTGNQKITLAGGTYSDMVLKAGNCQVVFSSDVILENVVITTTNTSTDSFKGPSGQNGAVSIGRNDDCATGGGAQLITRGGVHFAAGLQMYGGQIIAGGDVSFAANANGIMGASIVAGGRIDGRSNMDMGHCGTGMEDNFGTDYFRLAR